MRNHPGPEPGSVWTLVQPKNQILGVVPEFEGSLDDFDFAAIFAETERRLAEAERRQRFAKALMDWIVSDDGRPAAQFLKDFAGTESEDA